MTILDDKQASALTTEAPSTATTPSAAAATTPAQQQKQPPRELRNDPARTGFDPQTKWWMNYFNVLTGRMTAEGAFHYREARYRANEERDCKRCEEHRDWLLAFSPTVRFLNEKITALNGTLDASNIQCRRCPARLTEDGEVHRQSGGFSPAHGIMICANEVRDRKHLEDTLSHEMVHAWDHLRWKVDWMGDLDLKHAACTEIRASTLSGECRWTREAFTRGNWSLSQQFQDCVRKRAIQSVLNRPRCKDDVQATKVVNQVWDSCFSDTRPFDEVYR
ncbi:peptidase M76 family protein [Colletotrichum orchidophilum]|uniref:Mitochondrial inner membrane protease ATP23 n=1 Tax=Colletotrichum orchidophilum TaxID=1209926 RepID=A0A1G4BMF5_9PEZI|nr:peptidase M76 family protein [Colletotrichum orchidophilum]OHF02594.1 peptidase M76 family protein [Colletotrichum orchidophilum]